MPTRKISDLLGTSAPGSSTGGKAKAPGRAPVPTQPPAAPDDPPAAPGDTVVLSAELGEMLATMAELVASVSNRMDGHTDALIELAHAAAETHAAALAARPDPGRLAAEVEDAFAKSLGPHLRELTAAVAELSRTAQAHGDARNRAEVQLHNMKRDLRAARADTLRWKGYLGVTALGSLLLALLLTLTLPRVMPPTSLTCPLAGGSWLSNETGREACVFWAPE